MLLLLVFLSKLTLLLGSHVGQNDGLMVKRLGLSPGSILNTIKLCISYLILYSLKLKCKLSPLRASENFCQNERERDCYPLICLMHVVWENVKDDKG